MKKLLLTLIVAVSVSAISFAQVNGPDYKAGIGLRLGGGYYDVVSASLKVFPTTRGAFEFNLGGRHYAYGYTNISASAAFQYHFPIGNIEGFKWFVGGGVTAFNTFSKYDDYDGFGLAIFPTGGVEYKFAFPLAVSADIRPSFSIIESYDDNGFHPGNFGLSARYTFR
jgi:hypothetical protein